MLREFTQHFLLSGGCCAGWVWSICRYPCARGCRSWCGGIGWQVDRVSLPGQEKRELFYSVCSFNVAALQCEKVACALIGSETEAHARDIPCKVGIINY